MPRRFRFALFTGVVSAALPSISLCLAADVVLQADEGRQWYRGNMHTHSHWSDGDDYLDNIALWYRSHGYQFLVFTDHNVLAEGERWIDVEASKGGATALEKLRANFPEDVDERTGDNGAQQVRLNTFREVAERMNIPGQFLLVQGEEISDSYDDAPIHLNVSNVQQVIPPMKGNSVADTMQNNIRAALDQRERTGEPMIVHLNHPNFGYAVTAEDMLLIRGEKFFEVFNGHPGVRNVGDQRYASTERIWDIVLTRRLAEFQLPLVYGLATDDSHSYHENDPGESNPGRGWVMVLARELSTRSLVDALEAGEFYASSGVTLRRVEITPSAYSVAVDPVEGETYKIEFFGSRRGYDATSEPVVDDNGNEIRATRRYSADIGETLAAVDGPTATYEFAGDEIYVRARITSSAVIPETIDADKQQRAWCQPVVCGYE